MPASKKANARATFRSAIGAAECLVCREGLTAIAGDEGKGQITAEETRNVLGSVFIDEDCKKHPDHANESRWDYVLGYERGGKAVAYFVEVHSANPRGVTKIAEKLRWLRDFLERDPQVSMKKLPREFHWVASKGIDIPKHVRQYKLLTTTLRAQGLRGPVKHLTLA